MAATSASELPVLFFDIDNCLYPKSTGTRVLHLMSDLIDKYFEEHLELSQKDANELHLKYYRDYGLAIEGLVRHHKVDPLEYNTKVDDALPLEEIIKPDPKLRKLLEGIDRTKVRLWLLTNAYITHGKRVTRLLGVDDLFEGMTYCDYGADKFICKPHKDMYAKAMKEAGISNNAECYFVDDSHSNIVGAHALGWHAVHLLEASEPQPAQPASPHQISSLQELPNVFPQFFKTPVEENA